MVRESESAFALCDGQQSWIELDNVVSTAAWDARLSGTDAAEMTVSFIELDNSLLRLSEAGMNSRVTTT